MARRTCRLNEHVKPEPHASFGATTADTWWPYPLFLVDLRAVYTVRGCAVDFVGNCCDDGDFHPRDVELVEYGWNVGNGMNRPDTGSIRSSTFDSIVPGTRIGILKPEGKKVTIPQCTLSPMEVHPNLSTYQIARGPESERSHAHPLSCLGNLLCSVHAACTASMYVSSLKTRQWCDATSPGLWRRISLQLRYPLLVKYVDAHAEPQTRDSSSVPVKSPVSRASGVVAFLFAYRQLEMRFMRYGNRAQGRQVPSRDATYRYQLRYYGNALR
ncbi:hypothetical protein BU23DRAFT_572730 [Bimuria novae-zelandiae CBS 107.79]|uniref:Uncharacterized protein n=1 Tax=Bimuria novae-zelandiae CBS 107.79 TaxID=1447943 RepID=A0A6A5UTN4_9PLEO|nr:hypothetical protein BU23DRAFT_572730 [Bimuria novae-zelandiae CBS 107.79]